MTIEGWKQMQMVISMAKYAEDALTQIQLLGDIETVKLARQFALANDKDFYSSLLIQLRKDLRKELDAIPLPDDSTYDPFNFRIKRWTPANDTLTSAEQINLIIRLNETHQELLK